VKAVNYDDIENLVNLAKVGHQKSKESLAQEFTPLILKLSKRSFINSYEFEDIKNECYKTLFKCVSLYNLDKHRFVAYATNAIKNSVNHLIRVSVRREGAEGISAFILDGQLENILYSNIEDMDDLILSKTNKAKLKPALENLNPSDQELINFIYLKGHSLKKYAEFKNLPYTTAFNRKNSALKKLKRALSPQYLN
jgi:RNA polymerase sigma factor (sigma-70 family)